ncbi:hypothetical protein ACPPVO_14185 [Dactylosporangium sp. McL0621]|uniref:hypothetical protein n=1 Tax=Dactylosporangium sp. McL0621 TaxID=3415678 RepID=UPI003CF3B21F
MNRLWSLLAPEVRARVDEELAGGAAVRPIQLVREGCELEDGPPGLVECRETVQLRRLHLQAEGLLPPAAAAGLDAALARARLLAAPLAAVEALWIDGADGPYVRVVAVVRRPGARHAAFDEVPLAAMPDDAAALGAGLRAALGVPFYFPGPGGPRWWDSTGG